jgi:hypothetical protein
MNLWDYEARALWHDNPLLWDYRVRMLRQEAVEAGDDAQVLLCDHALGDRNPTLEPEDASRSAKQAVTKQSDCAP